MFNFLQVISSWSFLDLKRQIVGVLNQQWFVFKQNLYKKTINLVPKVKLSPM